MGAYDRFVNYADIDPFKHEMRVIGEQTRRFPRTRGVEVDEDGFFWYTRPVPHAWMLRPEGLGNKDYIAEIMYRETGDPSHFAGIGIDTGMMAVYDVIRHGALPVAYGDEVAASRSSWFRDAARRRVICESFFELCRMCRMALVGGESPAYRFLINPLPPVEEASTFSGAVVGILAPREHRVVPHLRKGAVILGARSSGLHANGASIVIDEGLKLADGFFTVLPNGRTYGEEALIPCVNYTPLVEALLNNLNVPQDILSIVPITGGGVAKLAADRAPFVYRITDWVDYPPLFRYLLSCGISIRDCLTTFNMGIGMALILTEAGAEEATTPAARAGWELVHLGHVEDGEPMVIFEPEGGIELPPPGL